MDSRRGPRGLACLSSRARTGLRVGHSPGPGPPAAVAGPARPGPFGARKLPTPPNCGRSAGSPLAVHVPTFPLPDQARLRLPNSPRAWRPQLFMCLNRQEGKGCGSAEARDRCCDRVESSPPTSPRAPSLRAVSPSALSFSFRALSPPEKRALGCAISWRFEQREPPVRRGAREASS